MNLAENFLELVEIKDIKPIDQYINMVDISIKENNSFLLANGLISHNSAAGAVKQARDSEREGVYALKGKVKNTKRLSDLTSNTEILEIMSILGITPDEQTKPQYDKIVIACDADADGYHINSLLINLFYKWFSYIIEEKRLYNLVTPLVVCDHNDGRKYFYSLNEFEKYKKNRKLYNVNYLKGLGSLSMDDWEHVMQDKVLFQIVKDRSANRFLDIAFGNSSQKRKDWLEGIK